MRELSTDFQAHLDTGVTTLCRCWRIRRTDGHEFGFSDHDVDISFENTVFAAASGMNASTLQSASGLSVDNAEAVGALSSDLITATDIEAGLYDDAEIWHWIVNWKDTAQRSLLFRGQLGEIRHGPNAFEVELRSLSDRLNTPIGRSYLRTCSAALGDQKCQFDIGTQGYLTAIEIARVTNKKKLYFKPISSIEDRWFVGGTVRWLSGDNQGSISLIQRDVTENSERHIELKNAPAFPVNPTDQAELVAGCDKRATTCKEKFANILNFQGFPFIPGDDWATAYPVTGGDYQGQSITNKVKSQS